MKIYLHGVLRKRFGEKPINLDVKSPAMMFRGLFSQIEEFDHVFRNLPAGFSLICYDEQNNELKSVAGTEFASPFTKADSVHIVPGVAGGGVTEAIATVFMEMGAGYATATTMAVIVVNVATMVALSAVSAALAPSPSTSGNGNEKPEERGSFIYNGPVNTIGQGGPVTLVYGEHLVGSTTISAGVKVEEIPV